MKINFKYLSRAAAALCFAVMTIVACKPDNGPVEEEGVGGGTGDDPVVEQPVEKNDSLVNVLYKQARAMQVVLTGEGVQVASVKAEGDKGLYNITLSTGAAFQVYVDAAEEFAGVLTYVEADGQKYWAVADKDGQVQPVVDQKGAKIALTSEMDVKVDEDKCFLTLADQDYDMGYTKDDAIQMFHCSLMKDANDLVYAIEMSFAGDKKAVVYVAEYDGVYFYLAGDEAKEKISEIYVSPANGATVALVVSSEIAWKPVVTEGWSATVVEGQGEVLLTIVATAPAADETVEEGDEETLPELQIVSEDDQFVFTSVSLSDKPFHSVFVSVSEAVVVPTTGIGKFAYGISLLADYDEEKILAMGAALIAGTESVSAGCGVSEVAVSSAFAEILGSELDSEERYVLWAVVDGTVVSLEFGEIVVDIEVVDAGLLDADVEVSIIGANAVYCGVVENNSEAMQNILYLVNNAIYDPFKVDQRYEFSGSVVDFSALGGDKADLYPDKDYIVWVVPAVDGEYTYTENDVMMTEFSTNEIVEGGNLELTCSEASVTPSSISFDLSCDGAAMIYYAYLKKDASRYASENVPNSIKFEQIVTEDTDIRVGAYTASFGDKVTAVGRNLNDEAATEYWLFAVAVDSEGKYGKALCVSAKTLALSYNSIKLTVTVDDASITSSSATFKVTSTGDLSEYIYWVGRDTDPFWANSAYCGSTKNSAQKYMALNPDDDNIVKTMRKYGDLASDGTITITEMTMETRYIFVILEKEGALYSPVGYKSVTTLAADLGEIVREGTDRWNADKARIHIEWDKDHFEQGIGGLMSYYSFKLSCPKDLTAYIMCASEDYFDQMGLIKVEHDMIELERYSSRRVDKDHTVDDANGNMMSEPDYYKNGEHKDGQLMSVNDFYVHGNPNEGAVTYFAEGSHGAGNCVAWEAGVCSSYERALEKINYYNSIEPYMHRATMFGLTGAEADTWAQALLDAYTVFYSVAKPKLYINDGSAIHVTNPYATGKNEDGIVPDRVLVMLKDLQGNYYEPMYFEVPDYFEKK